MINNCYFFNFNELVITNHKHHRHSLQYRNLLMYLITDT